MVLRLYFITKDSMLEPCMVQWMDSFHLVTADLKYQMVLGLNMQGMHHFSCRLSGT
jgi:hypothetical protein